MVASVIVVVGDTPAAAAGADEEPAPAERATAPADDQADKPEDDVVVGEGPDAFPDADVEDAPRVDPAPRDSDDVDTDGRPEAAQGRGRGPVMGDPGEGAPGRAVAEIVSARTANSKRFTTVEGEIVAQVFATPVHVENAEGQLVDIDLTLEDRGAALKPAQPLVGVSLASRLGVAAPLVSIDTDAGPLTWTPLGAADVTPSTVEGEDGNTTAVYDGVLPGVQFRLSPRVYGVKDDIVLENPDTPREFRFALGLPTGTTAAINELGDVEIRTRGGDELVATLSRAFMYDSSQHPESGEPQVSDAVSYELTGVGPARVLTMRLDDQWLDDQARVWPVTVDPQTQVYPADEEIVDDTFVRQGYTTDWSGLTQLQVGNAGTGANRPLLKFDRTGFLAAEVKAAKLQVRIYHAQDCDTPRQVEVYRITDSWSSGSVTWGNRPSTGNFMGELNFSCPYGYYGIPLNASYVEQWAQAGWANQGMMLISPNENWTAYWKKLFSIDAAAGKRPYLEVDIWATKQPIDLSSSVNENNGNVTLNARYQDFSPDRDNGSLWFQIYDANGDFVTSTWTNGNRNQISSVTVPGLAPGTYTWDAESYRENMPGVPKAGGSFTVDRKPNLPVLLSPADGAELDVTPTELRVRYTHAFDQQGTIKMQLWRQNDDGSYPQTPLAEYDSGPLGHNDVASWPYPPAGDQGTYKWRARAFETSGSDSSAWTAEREFDVAGDGIGDRKAYTFEPFGLNDRMSLKVNPGSGNALLSATDLRMSGTGLNLSVSRFYNSLSTIDSGMGPGWVLGVGHDVRLDDDGDTVRFRAPTGYWTDLTDPDGDGVFEDTGAPGLDATLEQDGTEWVLEWRNKQTYRFNAAGRWIEHTDAKGNTITMAYDGSGKLSQMTDTRGRTVTFGYTGDRLTDITDDAGGRTWQLGYGAAGRLTSSKLTSYAADPSDPNIGATTTYRYDAQGRLDKITDPRGNATTIDYAGESRKVRTVTRSATTGHPDGGDTAAAPTWFFYDNTLGNDTCATETPTLPIEKQTRVEGPRINDTAGADPDDEFDVVTYCFDEHDRQQVTFDAVPHRRSQSYTSKSNITQLNESGVAGQDAGTRFSWNGNEQMTGVTLPTGGTSSLEYGDGRHEYLPTSVTNYAQSGVNGDTGTDTTWDYSYDEDGNLQTATGRPDNGTPADQIIYRYCYNDDGTVDWWTSRGDLVGSCDAANESHYTVTDYVYGDGTGNGGQADGDRDGELITIDPPGSTIQDTTMTYDDSSRVVERINNGVTTSYTYDALDRVVEVQTVRGTTTQTVSYVYDVNGNMTSRSNAYGGGTDSYTFDELNRIVTESPAPPAGQTVYTYNRAGQLTEVALAGVGVVQYSYDKLNRIQTLTDQDGRSTDFDYDNRGRRSFVNLPNGVTQKWRYDDSDRIECLYALTTGATDPVNSSCDHAAGLIAFESYTYGPTGGDNNELATRTDNDGDTTDYTYDSLGRLTQAATGSLRTHRYSYDERANLLFDKVSGSEVTNVNRYQQYRSDGRLCWVAETTSTRPSWSCNTVPTGAETFTYDGAGNMTGRDGLDLAYNLLDQTKSFQVGTDPSVDMGYADTTSDRRTSKGDLDFDYAQTGLIAQGDGTDERLFVRTPGGLLIGMLDPDSNDDLYYITDRLGSVIATTNSTGGVDQTYEYEPYGEQINPDPADPNPLRYAGGYHDTDTGLIKFGTRYYMPDLARWTQQDPVLGDFTSPFSLDPYQYVQGDPINGVDPSGRISSSTLGTISDVTGYVATGAAIVAAFAATGGTAAVVAGGIATVSGGISTATGVTSEVAAGCTRGALIEAGLGGVSALTGGAADLAVEGAEQAARGAQAVIESGLTTASAVSDGSYC